MCGIELNGMGSILLAAHGCASVGRLLHLFGRHKQRKIRRKAVYIAFKRIMEAEVIQFPRQVQKPRVPQYPIRPEELHDYETIARWLRLADELLHSADEDRNDCWDDDDRRTA
jgi:hypothetical protein